MDIYKLYRNFWDYSFEHPQSIRPTHVAIYSFAVEHCNRLGWKQYFGFPTSMAMEATGVKSYSVFKKHFDDLVSFGFFEVAEYSKNQYSSNVIALKENYKANVKALDKALSKHASKQVQSISESTGKSIVSIDIPINKETIQPINKESAHIPTLEECCQASQMSGYTAKQGEAYFHFRAKDDWMVAKGTAGVMHPIKNWRSDMVHVISKGYLERENPKDKYGNEAVNHHAGYYGKELK